MQPKCGLTFRPKAGIALAARAQAVAERGEHRGIEPHAGFQVRDANSDVVVHGRLHWRARCGAAMEDEPSQCRARRSWRILRSPREAWRNLLGETPAARWKVRTKLERSPKPTS